MRAISLWQPWASAIAVDAKRIETRSWDTQYRGPVAIHASKRCKAGELLAFSDSIPWCAALEPLGLRWGGPKSLITLLPFGAIVAIATLNDVRPSHTFGHEEIGLNRYRHSLSSREGTTWRECDMGDFSPGRYGWMLADVRALREPLPCRGRQGLWTLDAELAAEAVRRAA